MSAPDSPSGLPFTGSFFTLPLAVVGVASMAAGAVLHLFGYERDKRRKDNRWPDISDSHQAL